MGNRSSRRPSISLFSFQDIVTSVTAILILVVLILTLELISRKFTEAAGDVSATTTTIATSVADLEALVAQLQASQPQDDVTSPLAPPPAATERDVRILRNQRERLLHQVADARNVRDEARKLAEAAINDLKKQESLEGEMLEQERDADDLTASTRRLNEENAKERDRLKALEDEVNSKPKGQTELIYRRPRDASRQPWLLEVSAAGVVALRLGTGKPEPLGSNDGSDSPFAAWAARLVPRSDYVLVLIRPSGIEASEEVLSKLSTLGIPHGSDFIGEDQEVHDGSTSADDADSETEAQK